MKDILDVLSALQPTPAPIMKLVARWPKSNPLRFLYLYGSGSGRFTRQQIQRAIMADPPRRWDEQWETRTL